MKPTGPIAWMARHGVAPNLIMLIVIVGGILGLVRVKQEVFPSFDMDMVVVQVPYPGASPAEVEQGIVLAVEEQLRGVEGVKRVTSTSLEGSGVVTAELLLDADINQVLADSKSAIDRIQTFPEEAEEPVTSLATRRREVISVVIAGDQELRTLHALAEKLRARMLLRDDITQVELVGVPPVEISVEIPREQLEAHGLTLDQVAAQIRAASLELPGGGIETRGGEILVRLADRLREGHQFEDIVIRGTSDGALLRLGDLATIHDGYEDTKQSSFYNGKPAVRVTAYRVGDETPTSVSEAVHEVTEEFRAKLPDNIELAVWSDDSRLLRDRVDLLVTNAAMGMILVLAVLAAFLDLRLAFWVGLGIPLSFLGAFLMMPAMGLSINMITLFGLIITLGMVVDDAIVVGENIHELTERGLSRIDAAIQGTRQMMTPVAFAVLTTVAAFAPLFFVPGVMGKIFRFIPAMVVLVLTFSLAEAFFVLPSHLAHGHASRAGGWFAAIERQQRRLSGWLTEKINGAYHPTLEWMLDHRYVALAGGVSLLIVSCGSVVGGQVPFNFFPKLEGDQIKAIARMPYGTPIEQTERVRESLEAAAWRAVEEHGGRGMVKGMYTRLGEAAGGRHSSTELGSHLVTVELSLVPSDERAVSSEDVAHAWSESTPAIPGIRSLIFNSSSGPGAGTAVDVQLSLDDTQLLGQVSDELAAELRNYPALADIENSYAAGKPQFDLHLRPAARTLGLTGSDVARQVRAAFHGAEALREQRGRDEMKVMVRLPRSQRASEFDLEQLRVTTPAGGEVPLSQVAELERTHAPTIIKREDGRRIVNVSAELARGVHSPKEILSSLETEVFPALRAEYPDLNVEMVGQQREQREVFGSLGPNFLVAQFVIFALLAIPFRSYVQPLIVMAAVPFGFAGAIAGHYIMGYDLSLISVMGIIALSGVVVNDSLVLVDAYNAFRAEGDSPRRAITRAGRRRLRPILLTSLTTFFGLMPMIFETSVQARFLIPMAISLGFGILFSTVVVLILVPSLMMALEDLRGVFRRLRTAEVG